MELDDPPLGDDVIYQSKPATSYQLKTGHFDHRLASAYRRS